MLTSSQDGTLKVWDWDKKSMLNEMKFEIIDCQISSNHLLTLGAKLIKREQFAKILNKYCNYNKTILK